MESNNIYERTPSVPISIAHGQKNEQKANNIFSCSIILIVGVAFLMGIFAAVLKGKIPRIIDKR